MSNKLELLKKEITFENMFNVVCSNGEKIVAEYFENGKIIQWTYNEFKRKTYLFASKLQQLLGIENQNRFVGIHLDNCPEWMCIFWGLLQAGYYPILLDFRASKENLLHLLHHANALAIITNEVNQISSNTIQILHNDLWENLENMPNLAESTKWGTCFAMCTSGTTSSSKICVYNEESLFANMICSWPTYASSRFLMQDGAKILAFLPLYHLFGLFSMGLWALVYGLTLVYLENRTPVAFVEACHRHHITEIFAVPLLWNNLATKLKNKIAQEPWWKRGIFHILQGISLSMQLIAPERGLRFARHHFFRSLHEKFLGTDIDAFLSGGAYLPPQTCHFFMSIGISVNCGYGMTEAGIVCAESGSNFWKRWHNSLGSIFSSLETKMLPVEGLSDKKAKQIFFRGNSLYTWRLVNGQLLPKEVDKDGWFATGDLGIVRHGCLYLRGRVKDTIIKSTGENVYPDDVEENFRTLQGIENFCVLGLKENQEEVIVLVLYLGNNPTQEQLANISQDIYAYNIKLPFYKRVERVLVSKNPLPTTSSMKPQRQILKKKLEENQWEYEILPLTKQKKIVKAEKNNNELEKLQEEVRLIFSEVLGMPANSIDINAHFLEDLGGDSLQAIDLASRLEQKYHIFISDTTLLECNSVADITHAVFNQLHNKTDNKNSHSTIKTKKHAVTSFNDIKEIQLFQKQYEEAKEFNPYFVRHDSIIRDTSLVDSHVIINLGSYNYIGMSGHPRTIKAAQDAIAKYGTSASGSRLLTGEKTLYIELEQAIAEWKNTEASIVLVSGHATNVTMVGNFCNENDLILYDALAHNSIEQGCRLAKCESKAFAHNDYKALESILQQTRDYYEKVLIVIEGVYSMDGDIAPVPEFVALKKKYGAFLMVDEAHSACVLGEHGRGVDEYFNLSPDDIDIHMGTLSKGLGTCGGYIAGKKVLIDYLHYSLPGFVFSVGINPGSAAATLEALHILKEDNSMVLRLHKNIDLFLEEAHKRNFHTCLAQHTAIIPIMVGTNESAFLLSKLLLEKGVSVPPAVYPAVPKGKARLRFCLTSEHTEEQCIYALDCLQQLVQEHNITLPHWKEDTLNN